MLSSPEDPILNSPFSPPNRHWALDESGAFTSIIESGRRRSWYLVPIALPRRARQQELPFAEEATENTLVNEIRGHLERWRTLPVGQAGVTHETARLLDHWRSGETKPPLFFCQIEAPRRSFGSKRWRLGSRNTAPSVSSYGPATKRTIPASSASPPRWRRVPARPPCWPC